MAAVVYSPMTTHHPGQQPQPQPPTRQLHRATYVHVSDLTSAYNIDHAKLEQELNRVKAEKEQGKDGATPTNEPAASTESVDAELETVLPPKRLQPPRGGFNLCV